MVGLTCNFLSSIFMKNIQNLKEKSITIVSAIIALAYVVFLWNFWTYGIQAIGLNATMFWLLSITFFVYLRWEKLTNKSILWLVPLIVIAVSFSFHTTIFTTWVSILLFPFIFFIFTTHESHQNLQSLMWSRWLPITLLVSAGHFLGATFGPSRKKIGKPINVRTNLKSNKISQDIIKQIIIGVSVLILISVAVIIPLLSSADAEFARAMANFWELFPNLLEYLSKLVELFSLSTLLKMITFGAITLALLGLSVYWLKGIKPFLAVKEKAKTGNKAVTIGIILVELLSKTPQYDYRQMQEVNRPMLHYYGLLVLV